MIAALSTLLAFQLLGEVVARGLGLPVPGPVLGMLFFFLWFRATFPRYRYDHIMRLGWKVFLPICLVWLVVVGVWMMSPLTIWK